MNYSYENIRVEKPEPKIAVMSFIRPEKMNSWTRGVIDDMLDFFTKLKSDTETTVVIMRGDGTKAICAGMDFADVYPPSLSDDIAYSYSMQGKLCAVIQGIYECPQIVISQSFGHAIGGGFFIAMASDIRIIADNVKFSVPLIKMGMGSADLGSSYFLCRALGSGVTKDLLLTGRVMLADEAIRLGFASQCVPFESLDETGTAKAKEIAQYSGNALRLSKEAINYAQDANSLSDVLNFENRNNQLVNALNKPMPSK